MQCLWIGGGARLIASGTVGADHNVSGITTSSLKLILDNYKTGYTHAFFCIDGILNNTGFSFFGMMKINNFINWYNTYYSVAGVNYTVNVTGRTDFNLVLASVNDNNISTYIASGATVEVYVTN